MTGTEMIVSLICILGLLGVGASLVREYRYERERERCVNIGGALYKTSEGWACHKLVKI